jgi:hypothetical protein
MMWLNVSFAGTKSWRTVTKSWQASPGMTSWPPDMSIAGTARIEGPTIVIVKDPQGLPMFNWFRSTFPHIYLRPPKPIDRD